MHFNKVPKDCFKCDDVGNECKIYTDMHAQMDNYITNMTFTAQTLISQKPLLCVCIDFHLIYINVRLSSVTICAISLFTWFPRGRGTVGRDATQFNKQPHAGPTGDWEREAQHR